LPLKVSIDLFSVTTSKHRKGVMPTLAAVHDRIPPLLELGNPLHPELWNPFIERPDKEVTDLPAAEAVREYWKEINTNLAGKILSLPSEEWFQKHSSVSAQDFAKEPHRNKLNIMVREQITWGNFFF
jgi:hypothetical protein